MSTFTCSILGNAQIFVFLTNYCQRENSCQFMSDYVLSISVRDDRKCQLCVTVSVNRKTKVCHRNFYTCRIDRDRHLVKLSCVSQ
jgi:hypothetical protein